MLPHWKVSNRLEFQEQRTSFQMQKDSEAIQQLTRGGWAASTESLAMSD